MRLGLAVRVGRVLWQSLLTMKTTCKNENQCSNDVLLSFECGSNVLSQGAFDGPAVTSLGVALAIGNSVRARSSGLYCSRLGKPGDAV